MECILAQFRGLPMNIFYHMMLDRQILVLTSWLANVPAQGLIGMGVLLSTNRIWLFHVNGANNLLLGSIFLFAHSLKVCSPTDPKSDQFAALQIIFRRAGFALMLSLMCVPPRHEASSYTQECP